MGSLVIFIFFLLRFVNETGLSLSFENGISIGERLKETRVESIESSGSLSLLSLSSLRSVVLEGSSSGSSSGNLSSSLSLISSIGVGVESLHHVSVVEGVLLGLVVSSGRGSDSSESGLDLIRVDDSSEISTLHRGTVESISSLLNTSLRGSSEDGIKGVESSRSVDNESSEMTTRSKLEEVKSVDIASVNSRKVSGVLGNVSISIVIDNQRSLSESESGVSHLTLTVSHGLGGTDSSEIISSSIRIESVEHGTSGLSRVNVGNKRELRNRVNSVSSGKDKGSTSRGS